MSERLTGARRARKRLQAQTDRRRRLSASIAALGVDAALADRRRSSISTRSCASGRQPIMAFWHGRILPATYYFRRRGIVVITSENFDGEWIAGIIERFGYGTARGSTSRGARKALLQLRRDMAAGKPAGFTLDGPRGPARVAQPGAVWLAKATGNPVLPFHLEAEPPLDACAAGTARRSRSRSPPSRIAMGEPFHVARGRRRRRHRDGPPVARSSGFRRSNSGPSSWSADVIRT